MQVVWRGQHDVALLAADGTIRNVSCLVQVDECGAPKYSLEFHVLPAASSSAVVRNVTTTDVATCVKDNMRQPFESKSAAGRQADKAMRQWTSRHDGRPPPRDQIIVWLLERMVVVDGIDGQRLVFRSELSSTPRASETEDAEDLPPFSAVEEPSSCHDEEALPSFSSDYLEMPKARRRPSSASSAWSSDKSSWSQDAWRLVLEIRKSKQDIHAANELKRKQAVIADARKQRLLASASRMRTQAKVDKHTKALVHEATRDAIEFHKVLETVEKQAKWETIHVVRTLEHDKRALALGYRQTWKKGAYLGPGPHPTAVYVEKAVDVPFVYDKDGRKHDLGSDVSSRSVLDAAMNKIHRAAAKAGKELMVYLKRYDVMKSGTLAWTEFYQALVDLKVNLTTGQVDAVAASLDRLDAIDYGRFFWQFVHRDAFAKRWKDVTARYSQQELKRMFFSHESRKKGMLMAVDFFVALRDLGFFLTPMEEAIFQHTFDLRDDGSIDFEEFQAAFTSTQVHAAPMPAAPSHLDGVLRDLDEVSRLQRRIESLLKR
ncbi:hypothetical protein AeNC1_007222 [Aphanomyces euteiches]|nr:hypothetical protein AeNC1_007222 [Aphanomyces euteiches]